MPTDARPGGSGFTNSATVSDAAVFPHVDPTAPAGQKDRDITWAQMVALLGDIDVPQTATPFLITGDGTTTAWPISYDVGAYPVHEVIEVATKRRLLEGTHFYIEPTSSGAVVHIDRTGDATGNQPLADQQQVAVLVSPAGSVSTGTELLSLLGDVADATALAALTGMQVGQARFTADNNHLQVYTDDGWEDRGEIQFRPGILGHYATVAAMVADAGTSPGFGLGVVFSTGGYTADADGGGSLYVIEAGTADDLITHALDDTALIAVPLVHDRAFNARAAGLVYDDDTVPGANYAKAVALVEYCDSNGLDIDLDRGTLTLWPYFPTRQTTVNPVGLKSYGGMRVFGRGLETTVKTIGASGADVFQLNGVADLVIEDVTATGEITGGSPAAGSNAMSITGGGKNIRVRGFHAEDMPTVDGGSYVDGGKAVSIQPGASANNPTEDIDIEFTAKNVSYGFGIDVSLDMLETQPMDRIKVRGSVEDCYRAVALSGTAATTTIPTHGLMVDADVEVHAKNAQQGLVSVRMPGVRTVVTLNNTKTKAQLDTGMIAADSEVLGAKILGDHFSDHTVRGRMGDVDTAYEIGGTTNGGGMFGRIQASRLALHAAWKSATSDLVVANAGGNTVHSSRIDLRYVAEASVDAALTSAGNGNTVVLDAKEYTP